MRNKTFAIAIVLATMFTDRANACQVPVPRTFKEALAPATSVFVFRLDEAKFKRENLGPVAYASWVEGRISLVQNLYGNPISLKYIKYYSGWCGGVNLVVGHHYLIATSATGDTIQLELDDQSLYDIEGFYDPSDKRRSLRSFVVQPVVQAVYGKKPLPENFPPREIAGRTTLQGPPPPIEPRD